MTLLQKLAKIDRKAALIYQREIRLLSKRKKLNMAISDPVVDAATLVDSFNWILSRQGFEFWSKVYQKCLAKWW